jgi:membrane protease subunit HflC
VGYESLYQVSETEQVIITQFGKPVEGIIDEAGLKLKIPFIQTVNRIEKRILLWDGAANDMPTKDKLYITVDTFGRWLIKDPLQYFLRLRDERSAQSRLEDILGSETRNAVAKHELIEIVRTTKDRVPVVDPLLEKAKVGQLLPITRGRRQIEEDIFAAAAAKLSEFGIELLDIRFKRINYNESVRQKIYARMISERQQIAERFRSEGAGEAAKIIGNKEKDLLEIESEAYRKIQTIKGVADAKAAEIYSTAYNRSPTSQAFYEFVKTLDTYKQVIDPSTTLVLTTDSELYQLLNGVGQ